MSRKIDSMGIMNSFFDEPNRSFHIRELAKIAKIAPTTATNYLESFRKKGLLSRSRERNHVLYRANSESELFKEEKRHYNVMMLKESGLMDFLNRELNYPKAIILFGSYSKAENIKGSDIDIFVLSESKKPLNMEEFEKRLNASIHLFIYSGKELDSMKKSNRELLNNIINGIKLEGFLEIF